MAQRIFMAQTTFLIPLKGLGKGYSCEIEREGWRSIESPFCVKNHDMQCFYYHAASQEFFFRSFPQDSFHCVYHKVLLKAYVISFSFHAGHTRRKYFLAVSAKADKCFPETWVEGPTGYQKLPSCEVCTGRDLIYLQKAFYEERDRNGQWKGFFYPWPSPMFGHREWVNKLVAEVEGSKSCQVDFKYSVIRAFSADIDLAALPVVNADSLAQAMTAVYYYPDYPDFDAYWQGKDARFADCLLSGNDNINQVSDSCVSSSFKESYSKNKYERTYVGESGIVFLQTHHPFDLSKEEEAERQQGKLPIRWPKELDGSLNIYELCSALYFKDWLGRVRRRLDEQQIAGIKKGLAELANYLKAERAHLAAIDEKYQFVYRQMGIMAVFEQLVREADLRFQSYSLSLSTWFNKLMLLVAVAAFVPSVLQIIQNYLYNLKSSSMEDVSVIVNVVGSQEQPDTSCYWGYDPVMVALCVLMVLVLLIILWHRVLLPGIERMHRRLHQEMEDER